MKIDRDRYAINKHEVYDHNVAHLVKVADIVCSDCGDVLRQKMKGSSLSTDAIIKRAKQKGWHQSGKKTYHCPTCVAVSKQAAKRKAEEAANMAETKVIPMKSEAPKAEPPAMKEISVQTRRKILDEVEGRYDFEGKSYQEGWNDERVAAALGLPRKFVEDIREQFCGPAGDPVAKLRRQLVEDMARHCEAAEKAALSAMEAADKARALLNDFKRKHGG